MNEVSNNNNHVPFNNINQGTVAVESSRAITEAQENCYLQSSFREIIQIAMQQPLKRASVKALQIKRFLLIREAVRR